MIKAILDYLKSDDELVSLLKHSHQKPKIFAYRPVDRFKENYPYIVVNVMPFYSQLAYDQYELEVRIITHDEIHIPFIQERLMKLLHFRNKQNIKINNEVIHHSEQTRSGFFMDKELNLFEQLLVFRIKTKVNWSEN